MIAPTRRACRGFTLLEMLVVMTILGFVTSMALPAMQRWHDATQLRARTAVIVDALRVAALKATAARHNLIMDDSSFLVVKPEPPKTEDATTPQPAPVAVPATHVRVELPQGWTAERVVEARFLANGLCKPGMAVLLTERGERVVVSVRGPICAVEQGSVESARTST